MYVGIQSLVCKNNHSWLTGQCNSIMPIINSILSINKFTHVSWEKKIFEQKINLIHGKCVDQIFNSSFICLVFLCSFFIICRNWPKKSKVSFVHERVKWTNTPQAKISSVNDSQTIADYGPCQGILHTPTKYMVNSLKILYILFKLGLHRWPQEGLPYCSQLLKILYKHLKQGKKELAISAYYKMLCILSVKAFPIWK